MSLRAVFFFLFHPELQLSVLNNGQVRHIWQVVQPVGDMLVDQLRVVTYVPR